MSHLVTDDVTIDKRIDKMKYEAINFSFFEFKMFKKRFQLNRKGFGLAFCCYAHVNYLKLITHTPQRQIELFDVQYT